MDTKRVLIIGAVGVLSVGAYLYFRPKKPVVTGTDSSNSGLPTANPNSLITVPPKGTVITSPEEVEKIAQKIADAKALAIKIDDLKTQRRQLALMPNVTSGVGIFGGGIGGTGLQDLIRSTRSKALDTQIADLEKLITDLGYAEVNGKITQIV
jgi:hypothetical protein